MTTPIGPTTWFIFGTEMFADERPEQDANNRNTMADSTLRELAYRLAVQCKLPHPLSLIDAIIDGGNVRWVYVEEGNQRHRFAALGLPALPDTDGQELSAVVVTTTRKYKHGREQTVRSLMRATAEVLGPAGTHGIWVKRHESDLHESWPRFWMFTGWLGRGGAQASGEHSRGALEDILASPDDQRFWDMSGSSI